MKKSLLLLSGLLLAGCAPQTNSTAMLSVDSTGGFSPIGTPPAIWFAAGKADVSNLVLTVSGDALRANAPDYCKVNAAKIICTVPTLPAGQNFVLPMKGSNISAVATYKRGDGLSYSSTVKQ